MSQQLVTTYVTVNGTSVQAYLQDFSAPESTVQEDDTVMTSTAKKNYPGLNDSKITMTLVQDYTVIDALFAGLKGNPSIPLLWQPTSASASASNPKRTGNYTIEEYDPASGTAGKLQLCKVTLAPASDITRATS